MNRFIHQDPEFNDLLAIVANEKKIDIALIEKDYWIMHVLYSLKQQNIEFELKGGTSLSKGFGLINRFSEDIDIHIKTKKEYKHGKQKAVYKIRVFKRSNTNWLIFVFALFLCIIFVFIVFLE
jgi:predicted nucleotidyltransferase component of viral defense system